MLAIGNQVQVIGELHILGYLFQNVDAETFTALLDIRPTSLSRVAAEAQNTKTISRWLVFRSVSAVGKKTNGINAMIEHWSKHWQNKYQLFA